MKHRFVFVAALLAGVALGSSERRAAACSCMEGYLELQLRSVVRVAGTGDIEAEEAKWPFSTQLYASGSLTEVLGEGGPLLTMEVP